MKIIKNLFAENKVMAILISGLLGIILLLIIIFGIVGCVNGGKLTPAKLEDKMLESAAKYYNQNPSELPNAEGSEVSVTLETLIEKGYIKPLEKIIDISCTGNVVVKKNGENHALYPNLICGETYKTKRLVPDLIKNIITVGEGLYETTTDYYYKGEYVNNYVTFANTNWRIVSINKGGNIRLVKSTPENKSYAYDNRYNIETSKYTGINTYTTSRLKETLTALYAVGKESFDERTLKQLVAHDMCIAKRDINDKRIDKAVDCSEVEENQFISIPHISEYYRASNDINCTSINRGTCTNYNYYSKIVRGSWSSNPSSANSYEVFLMTYRPDETNSKNDIQMVIELDGKTTYISGDGTSTSPYIIDSN